MKMYFMVFGFPVKKIINGFELLCRQATNNSNWSFGIKIQFWEEEKIQWWQLIKTTRGVSVSQRLQCCQLLLRLKMKNQIGQFRFGNDLGSSKILFEFSTHSWQHWQKRAKLFAWYFCFVSIYRTCDGGYIVLAISTIKLVGRYTTCKLWHRFLGVILPLLIHAKLIISMSVINFFH